MTRYFTPGLISFVCLVCTPPLAASPAAYRLVDFELPPKDETRLKKLPSKVMPLSELNAYLTATTRKVESAFPAEEKKLAEFLLGKTPPAKKADLAAMAAGLWLTADYPSALILMGRAALLDPTPDNLNNYAALLVMAGGEHLALPILQRLNQDFPNNSTVLNNLGQAWFGLGHHASAKTHLDAAVKLHPTHPQANVTKAVIEKKNGNTAAAVESLQKAILQAYSRDKEAMLKSLGQEGSRKRFKQKKHITEAALGLDKWMEAVPKFPKSHGEISTLRAKWEEFNARVDAGIIEAQAKLAKASALMMEEAQRPAKKKAKNRLRYDLSPMARHLVRYYESDDSDRASDPEYVPNRLEKINEPALKFTLKKQEIDKKFYDAKPGAKCGPLKAAVDQYLTETNTILEETFNTYMNSVLRQQKNRAYAAQFSTGDPLETQLAVENIKYEFLLQLRTVQPALNFPTTELHEGSQCPVTILPAKPSQLPEFDDLKCDRHVSFSIPLIGSSKMTCTKAEVHFDPLLLPFEAHIYENLSSGEYTAASASIGMGAVKVSGAADLQKGTGKLEAGYSKTVGEGYLGPIPLEASANVTIGVEVSARGISDVGVSTGVEAKAGNSAGSVSVEAGARWGVNAGGASDVKAGFGGALSRL
jgi:tetratricopeptide (TPR) repeat protein